MYLVSARGKASSVSVGTDTAEAALSKLQSFNANGFSAIVLDERGRELTVDQLEAEAANEARAARVGGSITAVKPGPELSPPAA